MLPDKVGLIEDAVSQIKDGAVVMLGGFGVPGTPFSLIKELVRQGPRGLTIIKNDANETGMGVDWLLENGQVEKLVASHIGLNPIAVRMMNEGSLKVDFIPQGLLAERIRAAGAGLMGIVTDIGIGTSLVAEKQQVKCGDAMGVLEPAMKADFALVHAHKADHFGNLVFAATARNFNPLMAMAADRTIVEAEECLSVGGLNPDDIHLSGAFVDHVVAMKELPEVYGVIRR